MKAVSEVFPDPSRLPFPKDVADEVLTVLLDAMIEAILHVPLSGGKPESTIIVRASSGTRRLGSDAKTLKLKTGIPRNMRQK